MYCRKAKRSRLAVALVDMVSNSMMLKLKQKQQNEK
jgi:hypothetical protein